MKLPRLQVEDGWQATCTSAGRHTHGNSSVELSSAISSSRIQRILAVVPHFVLLDVERRLVGFEVELIRFHTSDPNPLIQDVLPVVVAGSSYSRSRMPGETGSRRHYLTYNIGAHSALQKAIAPFET